MLNRLRKKIDEIDAQLFTLFEARMDIAKITLRMGILNPFTK